MIDRRKNSEGYKDLTAYQAERNMERASGAKISDGDRADLDYYVKKKVALLTNDFLCTPTEEEIAMLMKQPSVEAIDRYARHILKTHWEAEEEAMDKCKTCKWSHLHPMDECCAGCEDGNRYEEATDE